MSCTPRDQLGGCEQGRHTPGDVRDVREPEKQWGRGRAGMLLAGDRGAAGQCAAPGQGSLSGQLWWEGGAATLEGGPDRAEGEGRCGRHARSHTLLKPPSACLCPWTRGLNLN